MKRVDLTRVSVAEGEVLAPVSERERVVEDVRPCRSSSVVDKAPHSIAVGAGEGIIRTCHLCEYPRYIGFIIKHIKEVVTPTAKG